MARLEPAERPFSEVDDVGVVICQGAVGWHVGLLYKAADGEPRVLHLAFHHDLKDEVAEAPFRWAQIGLDSDNKAVLAELLSRIAFKNPKISYGFNADGVCFDPATGALAHL
ncbi:hypothetical protein CWR43_06960 [Rhizobium sullae]|uniref:Uncharacterized protein n=1 Tax=Rhizobium sullae TaxID=50338 RepID=A0A2N0DD62_RHISU|nr:hypothetical protein [Rhizobium sullae]PKA44039.1 hypothetical protein CWR43_06960 [Rhizobium sullae]